MNPSIKLTDTAPRNIRIDAALPAQAMLSAPHASTWACGRDGDKARSISCSSAWWRGGLGGRRASRLSHTWRENRSGRRGEREGGESG